jgi:serine phosphatase RsbU (regulator of sigma subunit)
MIGRQTDCNLVLRDSRISRTHARVVTDGRDYVVEDSESSHGLFVNGRRVGKQRLYSGDRVEFGVPDCYRLLFHFAADEIGRALKSLPASGGNLGNLRALLEVSRAMQSSLSMNEVLAVVVDAALEITGYNEGYLYLKNGERMELRIARGGAGDAPVWDDKLPGLGIPLIHIRPGETDKTCLIEPGSQTVGMLRLVAADKPAPVSPESRELLQTLALEASGVLENARLLEEERAKRRLEEELSIARDIQKGLQPRRLPESGWLHAAGTSKPSSQVGGDYFDVRELGPDAWSAIVADVSGKGVSSALLASLLQGAFLVSAPQQLAGEAFADRVNRLLYERTEGEKYATMFYCTLDSGGLLRWANAGHCAPLLVRGREIVASLDATGMPAGLIEGVSYCSASAHLQPGDRLVVFTDGLADAVNAKGEHFGLKRLRQLLCDGADMDAAELLKRLLRRVEAFAEGSDFGDDITALVLDYRRIDRNYSSRNAAAG